MVLMSNGKEQMTGILAVSIHWKKYVPDPEWLDLLLNHVQMNVKVFKRIFSNIIYISIFRFIVQRILISKQYVIVLSQILYTGLRMDS